MHSSPEKDFITTRLGIRTLKRRLGGHKFEFRSQYALAHFDSSSQHRGEFEKTILWTHLHNHIFELMGILGCVLCYANLSQKSD